MKKQITTQLLCFFSRGNNEYCPQFYVNSILVESCIPYSKQELMKDYGLNCIEFEKLVR